MAATWRWSLFGALLLALCTFALGVPYYFSPDGAFSSTCPVEAPCQFGGGVNLSEDSVLVFKCDEGAFGVSGGNIHANGFAFNVTTLNGPCSGTLKINMLYSANINHIAPVYVHDMHWNGSGSLQFELQHLGPLYFINSNIITQDNWLWVSYNDSSSISLLSVVNSTILYQNGGGDGALFYASAIIPEVHFEGSTFTSEGSFDSTSLIRSSGMALTEKDRGETLRMKNVTISGFALEEPGSDDVRKPVIQWPVKVCYLDNVTIKNFEGLPLVLSYVQQSTITGSKFIANDPTLDAFDCGFGGAPGLSFQTAVMNNHTGTMIVALNDGSPMSQATITANYFYRVSLGRVDIQHTVDNTKLFYAENMMVSGNEFTDVVGYFAATVQGQYSGNIVNNPNNIYPQLNVTGTGMTIIQHSYYSGSQFMALLDPVVNQSLIVKGDIVTEQILVYSNNIGNAIIALPAVLVKKGISEVGLEVRSAVSIKVLKIYPDSVLNNTNIQVTDQLTFAVGPLGPVRIVNANLEANQITVFTNLYDYITTPISLNDSFHLTTYESGGESNINPSDSDGGYLEYYGYNGEIREEVNGNHFKVTNVACGTEGCLNGGTCDHPLKCTCPIGWSGPHCECSTVGLPDGGVCNPTGGKEWKIATTWNVNSTKVFNLPTGYTFFIEGNCTVKGKLVIGEGASLAAQGFLTVDDGAVLEFKTTIRKEPLQGGGCSLVPTSTVSSGEFVFTPGSNIIFSINATGFDTSECLPFSPFSALQAANSKRLQMADVSGANIRTNGTTTVDGTWDINVSGDSNTTVRMDLVRAGNTEESTIGGLRVNVQSPPGTCPEVSKSKGLVSLLVAPCSPNATPSAARSSKWYYWGAPVIAVGAVLIIVGVVLVIVFKSKKAKTAVLPYRGTN